MPIWHNDLADSLSLDGAWECSLAGQAGVVQVPGCWEAQGFARRVDGPAHLWRTVAVPASWAGQRIQLQFDAVSYHAEVAVNGHPAGIHTGSWTPFAFDVTDLLTPGADADISLTVWKPGGRFPLRESLAGFLPDVAVMFGGIWQSARLVAHASPALSDVTVLSDPAARQVRITARAHDLERLTSRALATIEIRAPDGHTVASWHGTLREDELDAVLRLPAALPWSPDHPHLYTANIRLLEGTDTVAQIERRFGLRALAADGDQLLFNGEPVCLRGALNWGWYPERLCPDPDEATIRDEFRRIRALGFNLMKLCLYVPSPRYFEIADEEGMFLWLELPLWLPHMSPHLEQQAPLDYVAIVAAVHHHPSIVIYSLGCELEGNVPAEWLARLNTIVRAGTRDALVCDNSGSGEAYGASSDLADFEDYHFYCDTPFLQPLVDHFHRDWRPPRPLIFGEFCAADDFRDLAPLRAAHDGELPWWLQEQNPIHPLSKIAHIEQEQRMAALALPLDTAELVDIARQQSFGVRKMVLEKVRAWSKLGGYVVTGLRDTPLATSALFDDFNQHKYDPEAFRQFNADTVLLLDRRRARQWSYDGDRPAPLDPYCVVAGRTSGFELLTAHTGSPAPAGEWQWQITGPDGATLASGQGATGPLDPGRRVHRLGPIAFDAPDMSAPLACRLEASYRAGTRHVRNAWPLWVFPAVTDWPAGLRLYDPAGSLDRLDDLRQAAPPIAQPDPETAVLITSALDRAVLDFLAGGGRALLLQSSNGPLPVVSGPFWWHAIHLFADHALWRDMAHPTYLDERFYGLTTPWAFDTTRLAAALPVGATVTPVWRRLHPSQFTLAEYLFEAALGNGRLIASTLRFQGGLGDQPAGLRDQVAGRWLLYALLRRLMED